VATTLYVIPGSHPSMTVRLMLEHKGIEYKRVDLMPVISKAALKALRFPGVTVPALKIDDRPIQGSLEIARELDRLRPEPPLFPGDPDRRVAVEEAERWGTSRFREPRGGSCGTRSSETARRSGRMPREPASGSRPGSR